MSENRNKETLLTHYLLGLLNEEEQAQVEQEYFASQELYDLLLTVEDELLDAYATKRLSGEERERFENYYLRCPNRRDRMEFAELWNQMISTNRVQAGLSAPVQQPTPRRFNLFGFFRKSAMLVPLAASVILVLVSVWMVLENSRLREQLTRLQAQQNSYERENRDLQEQIAAQKQQTEQLSKELQEQIAQSPLPEGGAEHPAIPAMTFALLPDLTRGSGQVQNLVIPKAIRIVRLQPRFRRGNYETYNAELQTVEGKQVWKSSALKSMGKGANTSLLLKLPAGILATGDYILTVSGAKPSVESELVAEYSFRIKKD